MLKLLLFLPIFLSCSADRSPGELFGPSEAGTLVVDAVLIVDQSLPPIHLYETAALDQPYQRSEVAVKDANIIITTDQKRYDYQPVADSTGLYVPIESVIISPNTLYALEVDLPDGRKIQASTETPDRIKVHQ